MNLQGWIQMECVGFFLGLVVMSGVAAGNGTTAVSVHPLPAHAPAPTHMPTPNRPAVPNSATAVSPQPAPVPPVVATPAATVQASSGQETLLWLVITAAAGAFVGLLLWGCRWHHTNGRFSTPSIFTQGAHP